MEISEYKRQAPLPAMESVTTNSVLKPVNWPTQINKIKAARPSAAMYTPNGSTLSVHQMLL